MTTAGCSCGEHNPKCKPGKHPRTWHGVIDATTDEEQIRKWWKQWPDANIGIATGKASRLVVVDIDARSGLTVEDAMALCGGATPTVLTGSGFWHFYFFYPEGGPIPSDNKFAPGVEVKSDGLYVVAPPSLHASGKRYVPYSGGPVEWVHAQPMPNALAERLRAVKTPQAKPFPNLRNPGSDQDEEDWPSMPEAVTMEEDTAIAYWLGWALRRVKEGERHTVGRDLAGQLRDNGVPREVAGLVMARYARAVRERGDHLYTLAEAQAVLAWAYSQEARKATELLALPQVGNAPSRGVLGDATLPAALTLPSLPHSVFPTNQSSRVSHETRHSLVSQARKADKKYGRGNTAKGCARRKAQKTTIQAAWAAVFPGRPMPSDAMLRKWLPWMPARHEAETLVVFLLQLTDLFQANHGGVALGDKAEDHPVGYVDRCLCTATERPYRAKPAKKSNTCSKAKLANASVVRQEGQETASGGNEVLVYPWYAESALSAEYDQIGIVHPDPNQAPRPKEVAS